MKTKDRNLPSLNNLFIIHQKYDNHIKKVEKLRTRVISIFNLNFKSRKLDEVRIFNNKIQLDRTQEDNTSSHSAL
jgi:hypothetical protein